MIFLLIGATLTAFVRESWPLYSFCIAVLLVLAVTAGKRQLDRVSLLPLLIPAFGLLQLLLQTSVYAPSTREAALRWFSLAGVLMIAGSRWPSDRDSRERFLDQFVLLASITSILCLLQLHSSQGKVLWLFQTGYDDVVYAFFASRNHYGQFVELALAVALCRALTDRERGLWFGLASALLYASAIASTSRGAAVLATAELLIVPAVTLWRSRKSQIFHSGLLYVGVLGLALAWTALSGWDATWKRFAEPDAYAGRREFAESALQMAKDRPLIGHGLGTFPIIYPQYAKFDSPERVNHAHDDWAEFAAEGGFGFALLLFGLFALSIPRMIRHPWSLGLVFVMIHAVFDFPFPRLGLSTWMFALLGALPVASGSVRKKFSGWLVPGFVMASCALGIFWSGRLGLADIYFQQDTPASVARASRIVADDARYQLRLAQLNAPENATPFLERASALNPRDVETLIDLGLDAEIRGHFPRAEDYLRQAARVDPMWTPRWTLANYYFRRGNVAAFWRSAQQAMATASDRRDITPLLKMAAQIDSDPQAMLQILPSSAAHLRRFVAYLLESGDSRALEQAAVRLLDCGTPGFDRGHVLWAIEGFLHGRQPNPAVHLWTELLRRQWISPAAGTTFAGQPFQSSLDWRYRDVPGVTRTVGTDGGLRFEFSGQQPETAGLVERYLPVRRGVRQRFEWRPNQSPKHTEDAGVAWQIQDLNGEMLATSEIETGGVEFTPPESLVHVQLLYRRAPGTTRMAGVVALEPARVVVLKDAVLKEESALLLDHR